MVNRSGHHLIIDEAPALIYGHGYEPLFTEETFSLVQQMVRMLDAQRQELDRIAIPV